MRRESGFTLIELLVAVAIVGVLAMMAVPLMEITSQRQKETELRLALRQIRTAIDAYRQAVLDKKIEAAADASCYPPDLDSLANGVTDMTRPDGGKLYFLRRLPRDPSTAMMARRRRKPGASALMPARRKSPRRARMCSMSIPCPRRRA